MNTETIQFHEIVAMIRRHILWSILTVMICTALAIGLAYVVPKKFVAKTVLNIQSSYFRVPLVGDLVSASNDSTEFKAQRDTLMRYSLNNDFLDQLGDKFHLFQYDHNDRMHVLERDNLLARIEYFGLGEGNYQISLHAETAEDAFAMTQAVLDQIISTLISQRMAKLTQTRTAIEANLESLKHDIAASPPTPTGEARLSDDTESLDSAEAKLSSLEQRFTPQHPLVIEQRRVVERLRGQRHRTKVRSEQDKDQPVSGGLSGSHRALEDLYDDVLRKFNYLNIVIDMEKSTGNPTYLSVIEKPEIPTTPIFPKKTAFGLGGIALGVVISLLMAVVKEMRKGTFANPVAAAQMLEAPFLGSLPSWKMLEHKTRALPPPPPPGPRDTG
jgi:hypothetical protein